MPFDPNLPQANTDVDAVEMRAQLNGLKSLIDAMPTVTSAVVDSVTTLDPGEAATLEVSIVAGVLHLTLGIPRGEMGATGEQGPPFAQCVVDGVTTLDPGEPATVDVTFDATVVHFTFAIPRGSDGAAGEVTTAQLDTAIGGTSNNTNAVPTLDTPFADPDSEALRQAYNALVLEARR